MKSTISFICTACEARSPKWVGQCPACGEWNTLERRGAARPLGLVRPGTATGVALGAPPQPLGAPAAEATVRWSTGLSELDRALGGGLVPGSVTLLGGDPGIGKSTLLLQAAAAGAPRACGDAPKGAPLAGAGRTSPARRVAPRCTRVFHSPQAGHWPTHLGL